MKKNSFLVALVASNFLLSQKKFYEFPIVDGSRLMTMRQTNELLQNSNRLLANLIIKDKKTEKLYYASSMIISGLFLQPVTHEEGHRSILTELKIGAFPNLSWIKT